MTSPISRNSENNMDFWYSSDKWKDVLGADEAETICVPPCLDVLKIWKRENPEEAPHLASNILGQKGEAAFMLKFKELNMGGILVAGLEAWDLVAKKTVPKEIIQKGEWDAIFFHQNRGIFVIEVKATETDDENIVNRRMEKAKTQLDRNIKNIKQSFLSLYQEECTCIIGYICFPFRNEDRDTYGEYNIIDKSALDDSALFRQFFEPQTNETMIEVSLLQSFAAEFVCCRSQIEFHSQAYNAMQVAAWIMEQDIAQKQDPTKLINISGNGPFGKIILTAQQLEIVECREKCVTIRGAPGSGKTLILMLRALKAAMENKAGSVFVFVNEKLKAKYEHYFHEETEKIFVDDANNIDRTPNVHTIDKVNFAEPEDDVFFDETPVEDSYIEMIKSRANCSGSTTVVFTGLHKPGDAVPSFRLYRPRLKEFKHFELMKVFRGTGNIFREWEHYYPYGITIGHSIYGVAVKNDTFDSFDQVQNEIANKIATLISANISNSDLPSLKKEHIAVITCDENDSTELRSCFARKNIPCGSVNEQARRLKSIGIVAVDIFLNTPSYEWPVAFIVLKPGVKKEEILPIAASRCIAGLTIITYKHFQASASSTKADELEPTEEEILKKLNRSGSREHTSHPFNSRGRDPLSERPRSSRQMQMYRIIFIVLLLICVLSCYFGYIKISYNIGHDVHEQKIKSANNAHLNTGDLLKNLNAVQKSLKEMYSQRFRKVKLFSLPVMFDIEKTWVLLELRGYAKHSHETMNYSELLNTAFKKEEMLIIEGDPATGKTSLMRRLAYEWANGTRGLSHFDLVVYAEFREVRELTFESIADLVLQYNSEYKNFIDSAEFENLKLLLNNKAFCKERNILVLLDGYDESSLHKQCAELNSYLSAKTIEKPLSFYVVITTRPGYLSEHFGNQGRFVFADALGFRSREQNGKYIINHFDSTVKSREKEIKAVHDLLDNHDNLNKLAETPLFLTFICLVHEKIIDGTLVELYSNIIWWLIDRHQQDFPDRDLPALFGFQNGSNDKLETIHEHYLHFPQLHCLGNMTLRNLQQNAFKPSDYAQFKLQPVIERVGLLRKEIKYDDSFKLATSFHFTHKTIQEFLAALYCFCSDDITSEWLLPDSKLDTSEEGMNEFERFLLRIALSDKMPIQPEKRKYYFERIANITDIKLDTRFDLFSTKRSFNHELLIWLLSQCTNVQSIQLRLTYKSATLLSFSDLIKLHSVEFVGGTFRANSLSFKNCPSLKNLKFKNCEMKGSVNLGIATLPAIDSVEFYESYSDMATWQSITDEIMNSSVKYLKLSAGFFTKDVYPEYLHHLQKCKRIQEILVIDYSSALYNSEDKVTAALAQTAQKLPSLRSISTFTWDGKKLDEWKIKEGVMNILKKRSE